MLAELKKNSTVQKDDVQQAEMTRMQNTQRSRQGAVSS